MKIETIEPEEQEDLFKYTPLQRLLGHHLLDRQSFTNIPKAYLIATPIIIVVLILAFNLVNFAILASKMQLVPVDENAIALFKESIYFGILIAVVPQILLWSVIVHGLLVFLEGKGKFLKTLSIYSTAQIPVIVGLIILTIVASAQTRSVIYPHGFPLMGSIIFQYNTVNFSYDIFQIFNVFSSNYTLASNIIVPITYLYAMIIAAVGLSSEHKIPLLISLFVTGLAYVATMIFYFLV